MKDKKFHLGWFMNFTSDMWTGPFEQAGGTPWDGQFYVEMAKNLERAGFDFIMMEDKLAVSEAFGGTKESVLKHAFGMVPKHDPAPLATLMSASTQHLGIVATLSTLGYPPFMLARLCSTIDHISHGRFGWNIVTSAENAAAQNFGLDELPPREDRYAMADEYMDLVYQLWDSWEPDAVVIDRERGVHTDFTKVHEINFDGKYYKCRGPLNTAPSPQGRPTFLQAGGSPRGRDFAAKHADAIITLAEGVDGMREYREDVRGRAAAQGRNPDEVKVMYLVVPTLGETTEEALARRERMVTSQAFAEQSLSLLSSITDIDFAQFDLDSPLPHLTTNGEQGSLDKFQQSGSGKTLRELVYESAEFSSSYPLIGTPSAVADEMEWLMDEVGGDGFLITLHNQGVSRRHVIEVTDGLVPELQRRGVVRTEYTQRTLRETLREF
ncbi:NtaA/DmoA family FMN-dependent monooxygenase [Mycolicibacterium baixiangningiae]|uniref:NtaA/DmoA family FMN-dependent monooxygenase n=1 Tax=Mycolicibacterium baixiangningiae TaxID=2761578 RepID=UPI0018D1A1E3|nr:NtaA/DmoA family FMN-dependent monooxygenase [Mycolicibacterium baixiangningiae]